MPCPLVPASVAAHLPASLGQAAAPPLPVFDLRRVSRPQLRARSATEIVDAAFQLYRRDPMSYLLVSALCYAPVLVLQLVTQGVTTTITPETLSTIGPSMFFVVLGYWVSLSLMSAVIVRMCSEDYFGRQLDAGVAVRDAVRRLPAVMFAFLLKYILMIVGLLLFIVGLFYVVARYFATTPCIMLEGRGVFGALGRSAVLSRGVKLHILFTLLLAFLIFFVIYFAITILAAVTGSVVIMTVLTVIASILAYPLFAITEMLLYYDARVRNEGYDIEMMAEGL
jgi:hypothetical protein